MPQLDLGKVVGDNGKSAYQVAVDNGFIGDEQAWLNSLKGKTPVKGVDYFTAEDILGIESDILSEIDVLHIEVVQTLPTEDIDTKTIYLVPKQGSQNDSYDEYMYINNQWEHLGSTDVDLSNYYNKTETDTLLAAKQDNLVSGTNIKTINNQSVLGNGNIDIEGNEVYISDDDTNIPASAKIFIDESEGTDAYSEVVNSLSGNEIAKAPSVRAVNEALTPTFLENSDTVSLASGVTVNVDTCSIVAPKDGIAIVRIGASFAGTGGGYRYLNLGVISGSITPKANFQLPSNNMAIAFSTIQIVNIKAGDEIAPRVEQTSGSAMNVTCRIELAYL